MHAQTLWRERPFKGLSFLCPTPAPNPCPVLLQGQGLSSTHDSETLLWDFEYIIFLGLNCIIYKTKMMVLVPTQFSLTFLKSVRNSGRHFGLLWGTWYFRNAFLAVRTTQPGQPDTGPQRLCMLRELFRTLRMKKKKQLTDYFIRH